MSKGSAMAMRESDSIPDNVVVAVVQMSCTANKAENVDKALGLVADAAGQGANIIVLQELFATHYPCQSEDHDRFAEAETIPGPTSQQLQRAAGKLGVVIVGSLFERRAPGVYHNTAVVFDADGRGLGLYRKMHIPDDPLYYEKFYFTPGDTGFRSFPTKFGRVGVGVCWDQWFPETARLIALTGAEFLCFPTAIGWLPSEKEAHGQSQWSAWETIMRSHAIANGIFVAACNRTGREGQLEFWGGSFVADPYGNVLDRASHNEQEILLIPCQRSVIDTARTHWPFLRDRRIDAYEGLLQRFLD